MGCSDRYDVPEYVTVQCRACDMYSTYAWALQPYDTVAKPWVLEKHEPWCPANNWYKKEKRYGRTK